MIKTINKAFITLVLTVIFVLGCSYSALTVSAAEYNKSNSYNVVGTNGNDGSYIVSAINVKDYGAVGDGVTDDTVAIQEAFFAMVFGPRKGIIYFPAGKYRVTYPGFEVAPGYTIMGQWDDPTVDGDIDETVIIADYVDDGGTPLFCLKGTSTICNLSVYYPNQNVDNVIEYADTISTNYQTGIVGDFVTIRNITLYNSYKAINTTGGAQHVANIYGTVLKRGIEVGSNAEVSEFMNINFSSHFWSGYDGTDEQKIKSYTKANAVGMNIGYIDDIFIYNASFPESEFNKGAHFYLNHDSRNAGSSGIAYGFTYKINGAISTSDDYDNYTDGWPQMNHLDGVAGTKDYNYTEPQNRYSTKTDLFNVCAYGAKGNGSTDETNAFKTALEAAGENGGGIVFVPTGDYILTESLTVPENVEILGEWYGYRTGSPSRIYMKLKDVEKALFNLEKNSGVQGLTFYLPDNKPEDYIAPVGSEYGYANGNSYDVTKDIFPTDKLNLSGHAWLVRAKGINCWVENICVTNAWNGFDFASSKCDNFVARGIWGTCMNSGIEIGGGSDNGRISCLFFTFGTWWESIARAYDLSLYSYANTHGFTFGNCSNIRVLSAATFGLSRAIRFIEENGQSPTNISVLRSLMDTPYGHVCLELQKGNNLSFVGVSSGTHPTAENGRISTAITVFDSFDGKARLYGQNIWAGCENVIRGDVVLYTQDSSFADVISHNFTLPDYTYIASEKTDKPEPDGGGSGNNGEEEGSAQSGCFGSISACGIMFMPLVSIAALAVAKKSKNKGVKR